MKFSVIIPTKNRQKTAFYAVKSCTKSKFKNIEIIVSDVSDDQSLKDQIDRIGDRRIKYFYHSKSLSMRDNWEFAVSQATGDYVSIIGDDDALMPEGLLFAAELLELSNTPVLYCKAPTYKWPDYPLINRRNLIGLHFPTTITEISKPQDRLRQAYEFSMNLGTGPGIYHGLISLKFLQKLKNKRGAYFVDVIPDFDSGFSTLLYAERVMQTTYPIFISGQCASSNSGAMHTRPNNSKGLSQFAADASISMSQMMLKDFDGLVTNAAVIAGAMMRFLPEVNEEITGKKITINKQALFDYVAKSIQDGHEVTTFNVEKGILEKVARKWCVSPKAIPEKKQITIGLLADKGHNKSAVTGAQKIGRMLIDGEGLRVAGIEDAMRVVESLTIDRVVLLYSLGFRKDLNDSNRQFRGGSLEEIVQELNSNQETLAIEKLEKNITHNPFDAASLLLLGAYYFNQSRFSEAIPHLARSLSFEFDIKAFDAYFHSLINANQIDFARQVADNYKAELNKINSQLWAHCQGVIEMESGNFDTAANIFSCVKPEIDRSLYYYCAAKAKFLKGEVIDADNLISEALSFNNFKAEYVNLKAQIEAQL